MNRHRLTVGDLIKEQIRRNNEINENRRLKAIDEDCVLYENNNLTVDILDRQKTREFKNREKSEFLNSVRSRLLESAIFTVCNSVTEDTGIMKNLISSFIKEEGVNTILSEMKNKTLYLSEVVLLIEKAVDKYNEKIEKEKEEAMVIDPEIEDKFIDDIKGLDSEEEIVNTISDRVTNDIELFIDMNKITKEKITDVLADIQSKIEDSTEEDVAESYNHLGRRKINDIKTSHPISLFEAMVRAISNKALKDDSIKESFMINNKLNMDKVVESSSLMYTFLETINTLRYKDIDSEYISQLIYEMN